MFTAHALSSCEHAWVCSMCFTTFLSVSPPALSASFRCIMPSPCPTLFRVHVAVIHLLLCVSLCGNTYPPSPSSHFPHTFSSVWLFCIRTVFSVSSGNKRTQAHYAKVRSRGLCALRPVSVSFSFGVLALLVCHTHTIIVQYSTS